MNWAELENFAEYERELPCPNCKQPAKPTVAGGNFKCWDCGHLFREDGTKPEMPCNCKSCNPEHDPLAGKTKGKKAELQFPEPKIVKKLPKRIKAVKNAQKKNADPLDVKRAFWKAGIQESKEQLKTLNNSKERKELKKFIKEQEAVLRRLK